MRAAEGWRRIATGQCGLITRAQLASVGVERGTVARRVRAERWQMLSPTVIATTTGDLSPDQRRWHALLHAGEGSLLGGLTAAELAGLRNWKRDRLTAMTPYAAGRVAPLEGVDFVRTRRSLLDLCDRRSAVPRLRLEPAVLLFAAGEPSERAALGALAATVQQQLTSPERLEAALALLSPLRRSRLFRQVLVEIEGGAHSMGELDVSRMCRKHRLAKPLRQVRRRDAHGRLRFTDCEWRTSDGRVIVLEVDGSFHMDVESWEDDLARRRALAGTHRHIVSCTTFELRDTPERVATDLIRLGVPRL